MRYCVYFLYSILRNTSICFRIFRCLSFPFHRCRILSSSFIMLPAFVKFVDCKPSIFFILSKVLKFCLIINCDQFISGIQSSIPFNFSSRLFSTEHLLFFHTFYLLVTLKKKKKVTTSISVDIDVLFRTPVLNECMFS